MAKEFTVVVPTHNRADLLAATLECVVNQTLPPKQVIVVDDGSVDATAALLARYAARGVQHVRIENSGHLVARNVGLRLAETDLVAFCDSDDLWREAFLQTASRLWSTVTGLKASYANFAIVRAGAWSRSTKFDEAPAGFWRDLRPVDNGLSVVDRPFTERLIDFQPFFPTGMIVDRRAFLDMGGWDEGVSRIVGSDFATALRVAERPPVGIINHPLVGIRKHASNISGNTETMNLGNARVLEYVLQTRPELRRIAPEILASIATRRRDALGSAFARGDMRNVQQIYALLPPAMRRPMTRLKAGVAALPAPLSARMLDVALRLGSTKASLLAIAPTTAWPSAARLQRLTGHLSGEGFTPLASR